MCYAPRMTKLYYSIAAVRKWLERTHDTHTHTRPKTAYCKSRATVDVTSTYFQHFFFLSFSSTTHIQHHTTIIHFDFFYFHDPKIIYEFNKI